MSVVYQLAVTPWQATRYLSEGTEDFCGFAVDAARVEDVRDADGLRELLLCKTNEANFPADEPLHILKAPIGPFVHTRRAVGPLHPDAFLGGVTEDSPLRSVRRRQRRRRDGGTSVDRAGAPDPRLRTVALPPRRI